MDVYELTRDQINELKSALFYGCHENGNLDIYETENIENATTPGEISDEIVYSAFSGYTFTNDDFFS